VKQNPKFTPSLITRRIIGTRTQHRHRDGSGDGFLGDGFLGDGTAARDAAPTPGRGSGEGSLGDGTRARGTRYVTPCDNFTRTNRNTSTRRIIGTGTELVKGFSVMGSRSRRWGRAPGRSTDTRAGLQHQDGSGEGSLGDGTGARGAGTDTRAGLQHQDGSGDGFLGDGFPPRRNGGAGRGGHVMSLPVTTSPGQTGTHEPGGSSTPGRIW